MHSFLRYRVVDLNGQHCEGYATRAHASLAVTRLASEVDYVKQDADDQAFCARYGVPFQPRRYFVQDVAQFLPKSA